MMNKPMDFNPLAEMRDRAGGDHELPEPCAATMQQVKSAHEHGAGTVGVQAETGGLSAEEIERITNDIIAALKTVYDPEIPVDIYELGLVYRVDIDDERNVEIDMTLTAPGCPVAGEMPIWVQNAVNAIDGVQDVRVNMVFDPPWSMERMSEDARFALNLF